MPGNLSTFRVLEPYAAKVARTVLRRERRGNPPNLSDINMTVKCIVTKFCNLDNLIVTRKLGAFVS